MSNCFYDVDKYNDILKSKLIGFIIIAIMFLILFIALVWYAFFQAKKSKQKNPLCTWVGAAIVATAFLGTALGFQMASYVQDICEEAYVQYEGPASIRTERQSTGGLYSRSYTESILSFYHNGKQIELIVDDKELEHEGNIENIYVVYSKHSTCMLEYKILE